MDIGHASAMGGSDLENIDAKDSSLKLKVKEKMEAWKERHENPIMRQISTAIKCMFSRSVGTLHRPLLTIDILQQHHCGTDCGGLVFLWGDHFHNQ